ncbi:MAG: LysR family transcriptional regulator [Burkholderiales bacterium]|jgi:DNA-binding transcriptional LysR family regulator|nr:LysR family transcriptional regulator [Burkholderiales bacterium]NBO75823.1 LysR family transcriptional regulator [Betaproteobacteria bacterium]
MKASFRQLKLFLALAETGSVTAAARATHVTQPTASMQLRELTQAVGLPLYEVVSRKVQLTDIGVELAKTARAMVGQWSAFEQVVDGARGLTRGRLRVAVVSTAKYFMPRLIGGFCKRHPAIDVSIEILNRDGVVARLREDMDDLYIMSTPPLDLQLEDVVFMSNPLVIIAPYGDALLRRGELELSALAAQRFILRESGSGTRMAVDQHFKRVRFHPKVRLELGSNEAIKEAVAGGLGLGVISSHALHGRAREHGVAVLSVAGFPIPSQWHIVHPAARSLSPIAAAFKSQLLRQIKGAAEVGQR